MNYDNLPRFMVGFMRSTWELLFRSQNPTINLHEHPKVVPGSEARMPMSWTARWPSRPRSGCKPWIREAIEKPIHLWLINLYDWSMDNLWNIYGLYTVNLCLVYTQFDRKWGERSTIGTFRGGKDGKGDGPQQALGGSGAPSFVCKMWMGTCNR